ncbi:MAG: hypothetical protein KI790_10980 [Cyclobacteriaceae bacterium]|nr:hypothetical protein [Cyclobacteriaceae bacterium HetDA_MAG_MS6]
MKDSYSITFKNHMKVLGFLWQTSLAICVVCYVLGLDAQSILVAFGVYGVFFIPSLYLHIEYWVENHGQIVKLYNDRLTIAKGSDLIDYSFESMECVTLFKAASLDRGGIPVSPLEFYNFARIDMKSGEKVVLTCLLTPKVDKITDQIKGVKFVRKKKLFASTDSK